MQNFPPELLSEIFLSSRSFSDVKTSSPPLLFGQVCSYWRDIAYRLTPELWTDLSIIKLHRHCTEDGFDMMQGWIARAQPYAPSILIDYDPRYLTSIAKPNILAKGFLSVVGHLRSITLRLPRSHFETLTFFLPGSMPLIEEFFLTVVEPSDTPDNEFVGGDPFPLTFEGCLRLRNLLLWSAESVLSREMTSFVPWSGLTYLSLSMGINTLQSCDILRQATNLITLDFILFADDDWDDWQFGSPPIYVHSRLQTLDIFAHQTFSNVDTLFKSFTFPALTSLLLGSGSKNVYLSQAVLDLQTRSDFPLTSLDLYNVCCRVDDLITFLCPLHNLQSLDLRECSILDQDLMRGLTYAAHRTPLVPMLKELRIYDWQMDLDDCCFLDMLESRCYSVEAPCRLEKVVLSKKYLGGQPCFSTVQRGEALKRSGLELELERPPPA